MHPTSIFKHLDCAQRLRCTTSVSNTNTVTRSDRFEYFYAPHKQRKEKLEACNDKFLTFLSKEGKQRATSHQRSTRRLARMAIGPRIARLSSTAPPPLGRRSTTTTTVHNHHHPCGTRAPSTLPASLLPSLKHLHGCVLAGLHRPEQRAQNCSSARPTHDARAHDQGRRHLRDGGPANQGLVAAAAPSLGRPGGPSRAHGRHDRW